MNSLLPSFRSFRARLAFSVLGLAAAVVGTGCGPGDPSSTGNGFAGHLDTLLLDDGSLHILSRARTSESEGGDYKYHEFLYAGQDGAGFDLVPSSLGDGEVTDAFESVYRLAMDPQGRPLLIADMKGGLVVQVLDAGAWKVVPAGPSLSADAVSALAMEHKLGAVWGGSDNDVRILHGGFVFATDGATITSATAVGGSCALEDNCTFAPTGDLAGDAALYDHDAGKYTLRQLACSVDGCQWTSVPGVDFGDSDMGGSSSPFRRVFFHDKDGKGTLVRPMSNPGDEGNYRVLASTTDQKLTVRPSGAFEIGAAPRPGGGLAVAVRTYEDKLVLHVIGADGEVKDVDLGTSSTAQEPIQVHVREAGGVEKVHVVVREEQTTAGHFVVSLPGGTFTHESIELR